MPVEEKSLLIFTKNPVLGSAKTRIGEKKGNDVALSIYTQLLKYTRDVTAKVAVKKVVYFNEFIEEKGIWDEGFSKKLQVKGDLGAKMSDAFREEFAESSRVILIGSDCAEISPQDIDHAFQKLLSCDLVLGPAEDGGYYLIGMNNYYPFLFENMPWSEESLFEKTLDRAADQGLDFQLLPLKSDIDFWEDWEKLGWELS